MTKEELIELSDLNREDNIKYISSEAQGIAITLDSDRYAPTLCKLERAYICGRRKSEDQIEQLEKENAKLKNKLEHRNCVDCSNHGSNIKLIKAKEIIKNLIQLPANVDDETEAYIDAVLKQAAQFLSEVGKC